MQSNKPMFDRSDLFNLPTQRMSSARRMSLFVVALAAVCTGLVQAQSPSPSASSGQSAAWPQRALTLVVPFPPGGGPDLFARIVAERLPSRLGQPLLVENRPGVGGLAGANAVARASDGHSFLVAPNTIAIAPHVLPKGAGGGVDVMKDLMPVILPASTPMMLVVNPSLGVKSVAELVALVKTRPGLPYASAGNGSPMHIAGELFRRAEDLRWVGKLKRSDRSNIGLLLCISSIPQKSIWVSMTSIINSALVYQHHVRTQTSDRKRKTILFDPSGHPRAHISPSLAEHALAALLLQSRHEIAISDEATKHKVGICQ